MSDRSHPFTELETLIERLNDAAGGSVEEALSPRPNPPVDVLDRGDAIEVRVDLPGIDRENVDLRLSGRTLHVRADPETADADANYVRRERPRTAMTRDVDLPEPIDETGISASLSDGVLTVTLPKEQPETDTLDIDIE